MENNEPFMAMTVMEQPKLSDQLLASAVGSVVTLVAATAISASTQGIQKLVQNRQAKKLAKEQSENLKED